VCLATKWQHMMFAGGVEFDIAQKSVVFIKTEGSKVGLNSQIIY
jgi:hypothetical protein